MKILSGKSIFIAVIILSTTACADFYDYEPEIAAKKFCNCLTSERIAKHPEKAAFDTCTQMLLQRYFYYRYFYEVMDTLTYDKSTRATADSAKTFYLRYNSYLIKNCKEFGEEWENIDSLSEKNTQ